MLTDTGTGTDGTVIFALVELRIRFCNTAYLARIMKIMELKITSPYKLCMF